MSSTCCNCFPALPQYLCCFGQNPQSVRSLELEKECLEKLWRFCFVFTLYLSSYFGDNTKNSFYYGCVCILPFAIDIYIHFHRKRIVQAMINSVMNETVGLPTANSNFFLVDICRLSIVPRDARIAQLSQEEQETLQVHNTIYSRIYVSTSGFALFSILFAYSIGNKSILNPQSDILLLIVFCSAIFFYRKVFFPAALRKVNQVFVDFLPQQHRLNA